MGRARRLAKRPVTWLVVAGVVIVVGVGLALTEPWTLFIDERVDEALPVAAGPAPTPTTTGPAATLDPAGGGAPPSTTPPTTAPAGPVELSRSSFVSGDHPTSGTALALDVGDGTTFVRFEGLDTDNGPDLKVYLSTAPAGAGNGEVDSDAAAINLGELKGNLGDQNYEVPAGVDLSQFQSVVIWCERFSVAFGSAGLSVPDGA